MEKNHFNQARLWLECAKYIAAHGSEGGDKYAVGVAMAVHSIIKANDALTFKFMKITARRHDDAKRLFEDLIRKNFINPNYADFKQIIQEAINNKSKAEYRMSFFSKSDFDSMCRKADKFLKMAEEVIM